MDENKKMPAINLRYPLDRLPRKTKIKVKKLLSDSQFSGIPEKKRYSFWLYSIKRKFGLIHKNGAPRMIMEARKRDLKRLKKNPKPFK